MGDLTAAARAAETAFELAPRAPEILRLLGMLRLELRLDDAARQVLHLAIKADKDEPRAWLALAVAEERASQKYRGSEDQNTAVEVAIQAYTNALVLANTRNYKVPHQVDNNIGVLQLQLGDDYSASTAFSAGNSYRNEKNQEGEVDQTPFIEHKHEPLWWWNRVGTEDESSTFFSVYDSHTLCADALIEPPLHIGEQIKMGKDEKSMVICRVKEIHVLGGSSQEHEQDTLSKSKLLIRLSEPIRQVFNASTKYSLYRLTPPMVGSRLASSAMPSYMNLTQLHTAIGNLSVARNLAESALTVAPNSTRALLLLAQISMGTNKLDQAQFLISRVIKNIFATGRTGDAQYIANSLAVASALQWELKDGYQTLSTLDRLRSVCTCGKVMEDAYADITIAKLHFDGLLEARRDNLTEEAPTPCRAQQLKHAADHARGVLRHAPSCAAVPDCVF